MPLASIAVDKLHTHPASQLSEIQHLLLGNIKCHLSPSRLYVKGKGHLYIKLKDTPKANQQYRDNLDLAHTVRS